MKKIYYMLFLLLTGVCFNACVSEEEDLFDPSRCPARMGDGVLSERPFHGWICLYGKIR